MEVFAGILLGLAIFGLATFVIIIYPKSVMIVGLLVIVLGVIILAWFVGGLILDAVFNTDIVHLKGEQ